MTGIDAIIQSILDDANEKANTIINDANAEAKRKIADAEAEKTKILEDANKKAEGEYSKIIAKGNSSVKRQISEALLGKKQEIIEEVINKAYAQLISMSDSDYEKFIFSKLDSLNINEKAYIKFASRKDEDYGIGFKTKLKVKYPKLEILDEVIDDDGGFILINGMIEENMTFSAIFKDKLEEIKDLANKLMFEEGTL